MCHHNHSRAFHRQIYNGSGKNRKGGANRSRDTRERQHITDYHKATSLTMWLMLKHNMTYKQFRNKSRERRYALRDEYTEDTGREIQDGGDTSSSILIIGDNFAEAFAPLDEDQKRQFVNHVLGMVRPYPTISDTDDFE